MPCAIIVFSRHTTYILQENGIIQGEDEGDAAGKELHGAPETYQDGEFYQALLSEFLESSTSQLTQKLHKEPKNRKIVDRRASKGRKIRYHVHEKLVNFMTPDEADVPEYASRIFANLFGHRRPQEG
jgi:protein AATF/BFR2